jgi:uncharacterized membrane protein YjdF
MLGGHYTYTEVPLGFWARDALGLARNHYDPSGATAFLGMQGDPWDTQWDMFLALAGAMAAQLLLGRRHDRELARLGPATR